MPSIDLQSCDPKLREAFLRGKRSAEQANPGLVLRVTCTHRSVQEQGVLYAKGRVSPGPVVTQVDGVQHLSNHNYFPSRAIDFCVTWGGKVSWEAKDYEIVGPYFESEGLVWGGRWRTLIDRPHVELPRDP